MATPLCAVSSRERPRHIKEETSIRMTTDQNDFSIVRFSTDDLPEKDRTAIWREHFGPSVFKVEIEPPPPNTPVKTWRHVRCPSCNCYQDSTRPAA